jgi:oligopeptide/dipeptide ABC transporter ATP-binding protein
MSRPLLDVEHLSVAMTRGREHRPLVADVSFQLAAGEALGIVGESGSGKSLSMLALLQLLPPGARAQAARADFDGRPLLSLTRRQLDSVRGRDVAMVFQDPMTALNPVLSIGRQITEVLTQHFALSGAAARDRARQLLTRVGIADPVARLQQYPHEFSGGMRQRVTIAMALAGEPRVLIADEPTTALDVTVQAEIVALIKDLQRQSGMSVIWVTHDLALLARIVERVLVIYGGHIVEDAPVERLFAAPCHPYTRALLANLQSTPRVAGAGHSTGRNTVRSTWPAAAAVTTTSCPYAPRCHEVKAVCGERMPPLTNWGPVRVACWARSPEPATVRA